MLNECDYELYKNEIRHRVKFDGWTTFLYDVLTSDKIREFYNEKSYFKALYLLAMIDYLCRIHDIPLANRYDDIRKVKMTSIVYPASILLLAKSCPEQPIKEDAFASSIPEFQRFNIVEREIDDVA